MDDFELSSFLPYRLAVLSERVSRRLSVEYEEGHGLSIAEWRVLVHLSRSDPVSVRDIQTFVNLEKPRVSRAVARLEKLGLVQKVAGADDARLVEISLTPKGRKALEDILPRAVELERRLLREVSEQDLSNFIRVMEQLHTVLDQDPSAKPRLRPEYTSKAAVGNNGERSHRRSR